MPSDIRSFFGGKGGASSQESPQPPRETETSKGRRSKVRKVIDDSDDEPIAKPKAKATPKKSKSTTKESPNGEETTALSYFASTSNGRSTHSTPSKPQVVVTRPAPKKSATSTPTKSTPTRSKMEKTDDTLSSMAKDRASGRKRKAAKYAGEEDEDADFAPLPKGEEDSGSDVFQADFKTRKQMAGDYDEESGDDVKIIKPRKRASTKKTESENEDLKLPVHKSTNGKKTPSVASSRKRKSVSLEEDEYTSEDGNAKSSKRGRKKPSSSKKPAVKKPRATKSGESKPKKPTAKEVVPENTEIQAIFDSIPIIAPPSPPASTGDEKPKFKFNGHQNSGPASAAGSKEIPLGQENCLGGLGFVFTGLLSALSRDEGQDLVKRYGGKVLSSVSSKTSYVVLGSDAGPKKLETIAKFNIKTINEDGLFALITRLPANGGDGRAAAVNEAKKKKEEDNVKKMAAEMEEAEKQRVKALASKSKNTPASNQPTIDSRLWTVKYSPTSTSQICGNKGVVEKLQRWLRAWPDNLQKEFKHAGADGSSKFRAVIIHGPPGIGKTTAAHLVANLEGYDVIESNASDTRSKKLVDTGLKGILDNTSLLGYFAGDDKKVEAKKKKIVLIMDEVDGMSAGDRGGVGALAQVCKKTSVPMILICNDRRLPKMKPFDFVAFDLPFRKPTTQDIRSRINTICFREGIKLPAQVIDALIEGSKADIRQIINMISTVKLDDAALDFDQSKSMSKAWEKHIILKPWDVVQQLLSGGMFHATSTKTLNDKIELYFNDHELSFLMLEENYLKSTPTALNDYQGRRRSLKALELADSAAESISDGDLVDRMIHGPQQHWSLMPTHAVFSTVRPASFIAGTMVGSGGPKFPAWLGNNSKQTKLVRFVKEIQGHMRLRTSGDRHEIRQQYLPTLWYSLIKRLELEGKDSVEDIIELMDSYFLTKEDWDAILELGVGPMDGDTIKIDSQTKSTFTRLYNQKSHPMPFMKASNVVAPSRAAISKPDLEEAIEESEGEEVLPDKAEDDDNDMDISKDKYIKQPKKKPAASKAGQKKGKGKDESAEEESAEEDVKPKKGQGGKKVTAAGKGKAKR